MNAPPQSAVVTPAATPSNVHQLINMNKQLTAAGVRYMGAAPPAVVAANKQQQVNKPPGQLDAAETFRNLSATLSSLNSYTISLQNQLNLAAAKSATALAAGPTLAQAASVLSQANTLAQTISMYQQQHHHQQQQQQQPSIANIQSSLAAAAAAAAVANTSTASTCNLNNTLFVGNLHASLQEIDLIQVFRPFGRIVECCKKWLHFGFVKFTSEEEACHAYVTLNGFRLKGRPMRLEFQNRTKKAILAQAALTNNGGGSGAPLSGGCGSGGSANTANASDLLSMSSLSSLNGLPFVPSSSSSSGSSTPTAAFLSESASFSQFPTFAPSAAAVPAASSTSQPSLNSYFHALSSYAAAPSLVGGPPFHKPSLDEHTAAAMSFFNPDQLIKFANSGTSEDKPSDLAISDDSAGRSFEFKLNDELITMTDKDTDDLLKKSSLVSPSYSSSSPQHDLSGSSDSGCCRSNSFLNDEDSACCSLSTSAAVQQPKQQVVAAKSAPAASAPPPPLDELTISEHMEFTCSNESSQSSSNINNKPAESSAASSAAEDDDKELDDDCHHHQDDDDDDESSELSSECDTSDDASEIPTDAECLNEIDELIDDHLANDDDDDDTEPLDLYNQVLHDDGSVAKKKLTSGIYKCVNHTLSLFIEPNDVLKPMSADEYNEYVLFPNRICDISMPVGAPSTDSYFVLKNAQVYLM